MAAYQREVSVRIDGRLYQGSQIDDLLRDWCTNRNITSTIHFEVRRGDLTIFRFHDHPHELWAAGSEEDFVANLAKEALLRFRRLASVPSLKLNERLSERIRHLISPPKQSSDKVAHER